MSVRITYALDDYGGVEILGIEGEPELAATSPPGAEPDSALRRDRRCMWPSRGALVGRRAGRCAERPDPMQTEEAFETLCGELDAAWHAAQSEVADAAGDGRFEQARACSERGRTLRARLEQLRRLRREWPSLLGGEQTSAE